MADTFARQRQLIGTTAAWAANDIVPALGEIAVEQVSSTETKIKIGDGAKTFSALPYVASGSTLTTAQQTALNALTAGTLTSPLNLPAGVPTGSQAVNRSEGDKLYVNVSGDTMTGALNLPTGVPTGNQAVSRTEGDKLYVGLTNLIKVSQGAASADKVPQLNALGKIDGSMITLPAVMVLKGSVLPTSTAPAGPTVGDVWVVSAAGALDASWGVAGNPTLSVGDIILRENATSWAVLLTTVDLALKVSKAGDTMTGALTLSGAPTADFHAATKKYTDDKLAAAKTQADTDYVNVSGDTMTGALNLPTGVPTGNQAVSRTAGDALYVNLTGDTMTGALTLSGAPTADLHAATKKYTDDTFVNVSGDTMTGVLHLPTDGLTVGTTQVVVKNGTIGLGVTPSAWGAPALQANRASVWGVVNNAYVGCNYYFDGTDRRYIATGLASEYGQFSGSHNWYTAPSGAAGTVLTITRIMTLNPDGSLYITGPTAEKASGTTWSNPSDVRLKDNIQPFAKGLNELLRVDVKTWEYNGKGGTVAGMKGLGVIADEVMQVLPDTVDTYSAKLNPDDKEEIDIKRFDATEITWLLVNSIKEQQALITDLQTRLAALEAKP